MTEASDELLSVHVCSRRLHAPNNRHLAVVLESLVARDARLRRDFRLESMELIRLSRVISSRPMSTIITVTDTVYFLATSHRFISGLEVERLLSRVRVLAYSTSCLSLNIKRAYKYILSDIIEYNHALLHQ